jgi:hypothetical protein
VYETFRADVLPAGKLSGEVGERVPMPPQLIARVSVSPALGASLGAKLSTACCDVYSIAGTLGSSMLALARSVNDAGGGGANEMIPFEVAV